MTLNIFTLRSYLVTEKATARLTIISPLQVTRAMTINCLAREQYLMLKALVNIVVDILKKN